jgi:hypothetical protein
VDATSAVLIIVVFFLLSGTLALSGAVIRARKKSGGARLANTLLWVATGVAALGIVAGLLLLQV